MSEDYQLGKFEDGSILPEEEFQKPLSVNASPNNFGCNVNREQ